MGMGRRKGNMNMQIDALGRETLHDHGNYCFPLVIPTSVIMRNLTLCFCWHSIPWAGDRETSTVNNSRA